MSYLFSAPPGSTAIIVALIVAACILVVFVLLGMLFKYYKRCPSNRILVVYGKSGGAGMAATCVHGGARLVVPIFQDYEWLSLDPMQIAVPLRDALSIENIRVNVPSVFTVAVGTTPELMQNASIRLLGLSTSEIEKQASDIIFGQLRQVIASMKIEDINRDRELFLSSIQNSLEPELRKIGLVLINVNITDITDESGYIAAIGQKAASEAIQKARGDVADNEKMGEVRVADAVREKEVRVAEATKLREIGTREALRDQKVRMAELASDEAVRVAETQRDQQIGEQRASFEKEARVKDAERDMRIQLADADARAIEGENTSKADIAASLAALKVKQAEAYQLGESKKVQAEAAVIEADHIARTKAALAEAKRVEAKRRAELEAPAIAEKAKRIVEAEALAEQRRIEAEGEAAAIFLKLEAKARGQYEMLAKKGEGL
ncbi:MAG: SPFH domain-containing protein, partial [Planctomycetia bacterium]